MRRLYLQIYATIVGVLLLFSVLGSVAWFLAHEHPDEERLYEQIAAVLGELLPEESASPKEADAALRELAERFRVDAALYSADRRPIAAVGRALPAPPSGQARSGRIPGGMGRFAVALRLEDGRWVMVRFAGDLAGDHVYRWIGFFGLLAVAVAFGAYPFARRLTRRLERLQRNVDALGSGELSARVDVEGRDEVAKLAGSFNQAADRIERLVNAQKGLLASASHELRTPLARMRVALELLQTDARPELRERMARDIAELDELIDELLLASRLDSLDVLERREQVDLLALLAEEGARVDAQVSGEPIRMRGDARTLRRLLRNLLENARRYGRGTPIEASLEARGDDVVVRVEDRGPGIAEFEHDRIFEPFYRPLGTRETGDGVGLGLALVRQIARHHGGDAVCLTREGGGTRFEVTLASA